jgi:hypothetical protein
MNSTKKSILFIALILAVALLIPHGAMCQDMYQYTVDTIQEAPILICTGDSDIFVPPLAVPSIPLPTAVIYNPATFIPVFEDDFESGNAQGWNLYASDSTASTGDWVIGNPVGTIFSTVSWSDQAQPEDAYEGTGCIFTAQNSSLGGNDVDLGVVYLVSPLIDLSSADSAELEYVRWFYNRDPGEDSGDFFVVQVSNDNGANWIAIETLNTTQSANIRTLKTFTLESYISLTSTVRLRFGAADGFLTSNIIEAALDNIKAWGYGGGE